MPPERASKAPVVLIVEDEFLVADMLAASFEAASVAVLGPAASVTSALELIGNASKLDGAVLDVNLRGKSVFPVSDALSERGVPFVFTTGYTQIPDFPQYKNITRFVKPVDPNEVVSALLALISAGFSVRS